MAAYNSLRICDLSLQVKLGCAAEERMSAQEVRVGVELRFESAPKGAWTDSLEDTICYARISEALRAHLKEGEFSLVEKIANDLFEIVERFVEGRAKIRLTVRKVKPPVEGLLGGVEYSIGDFC